MLYLMKGAQIKKTLIIQIKNLVMTPPITVMFLVDHFRTIKEELK